MILPSLGLTWPDPVADRVALEILATFLILGIIAARSIPIDRRALGDAELVRARRRIMSAFLVFGAALTLSAAATKWNTIATVLVGGIGCMITAGAAIIYLERLENGAGTRPFSAKPSVPLDLRTFNVDALEVTTPPHWTGTHEGLRIYRAGKRTILALPRGSVATSILQHNGEKLAKIVAPDMHENNIVRGRRVALLGLDTTGQPFLLELPPEYADRSIDECERWLLQAGEEDEIIVS